MHKRHKNQNYNLDTERSEANRMIDPQEEQDLGHSFIVEDKNSFSKIESPKKLDKNDPLVSFLQIYLKF